MHISHALIYLLWFCKITNSSTNLLQASRHFIEEIDPVVWLPVDNVLSRGIIHQTLNLTFINPAPELWKNRNLPERTIQFITDTYNKLIKEPLEGLCLFHSKGMANWKVYMKPDQEQLHALPLLIPLGYMLAGAVIAYTTNVLYTKGSEILDKINSIPQIAKNLDALLMDLNQRIRNEMANNIQQIEYLQQQTNSLLIHSLYINQLLTLARQDAIQDKLSEHLLYIFNLKINRTQFNDIKVTDCYFDEIKYQRHIQDYTISLNLTINIKDNTNQMYRAIGFKMIHNECLLTYTGPKFKIQQPFNETCYFNHYETNHNYHEPCLKTPVLSFNKTCDYNTQKPILQIIETTEKTLIYCNKFIYIDGTPYNCPNNPFSLHNDYKNLTLDPHHKTIKIQDTYTYLKGSNITAYYQNNTHTLEGFKTNFSEIVNTSTRGPVDNSFSWLTTIGYGILGSITSTITGFIIFRIFCRCMFSLWNNRYYATPEIFTTTTSQNTNSLSSHLTQI